MASTWRGIAQIGRRGAITPVDLTLHAGEVVGLGGLLGSGRTETARLLFGIDAADKISVRRPRHRCVHVRALNEKPLYARRHGENPESRPSEAAWTSEDGILNALRRQPDLVELPANPSGRYV